MLSVSSDGLWGVFEEIYTEVEIVVEVEDEIEITIFVEQADV